MPVDKSIASGCQGVIIDYYFYPGNLNLEEMKSFRHIKTGDAVDNRLAISNHHKDSVPTSKLTAGSVTGKFPVLLDDGRTIVFIADKSREREIRLRYALRKG